LGAGDDWVGTWGAAGVALAVEETGVAACVPDTAVSAGGAAALGAAGDGIAVGGCCDGAACATGRGANEVAGAVCGVEVDASALMGCGGADGMAAPDRA
jgi:hypothetical protein